MTEDRLVRDPDPLDPEDRYILVTPVPSFSHGLLLMTFNLDVTSADASLLSLTKKSAFSKQVYRKLKTWSTRNLSSVSSSRCMHYTYIRFAGFALEFYVA